MRNLRSTVTHPGHGRLVNQIRRMLVPQLAVLAISATASSFQGVDLTGADEKDTPCMSLKKFLGRAALLLFLPSTFAYPSLAMLRLATPLYVEKLERY